MRRLFLDSWYLIIEEAVREGLSDKGRELPRLDIENEMKDYFISPGKVKATSPLFLLPCKDIYGENCPVWT